MSAGTRSVAADLAAAAPAPQHASPNQRAWARFKRNRLGYASLWIFVVLLVLATLAELLSNDRPIVARIDGRWHAPMFSNPSKPWHSRCWSASARKRCWAARTEPNRP